MQCAGLTYNPLTGIVYDSKEIFDLGYFLQRLNNSPHLPTITHHVRVLSFNLPFDSMPASSVMSYLNIYAKDPAPSQRLPGDIGVAADMCRSLLEAYKRPDRVPVRKWFQVIVRLLRCCKNVETIEVPMEWADVGWYDDNFPEIDLSVAGCEKRPLGNGRWRFGKDPVVIGGSGRETETDGNWRERSLQME